MRTIAYKGEGGRGLILAIFVRTYYVYDPYNTFENYNIQKANEMKEQNKKNKNAFENNKEFVRAQYQIFTLGQKKCQLYRIFDLGLAKGMIIWRFSTRVEISTC